MKSKRKPLERRGVIFHKQYLTNNIQVNQKETAIRNDR
ncbi:hypothetical protein [Helicobacter phage Pt4481G]|nr:hypothetical protein [Helicobacter phage Pt4481G]